MSDISKYIDKNGNFTHSKLEGTKEQISELIEQYRKTNYYSLMTDSQKILAENMLFPQIIETGMIPQGMLLEIVMPSVPKGFRFDELKPGAEIEFDIPQKYKTRS